MSRSERHHAIEALTIAGFSTGSIERLLRNATTLTRLAVKDCNEGLTPREQKLELAAMRRVSKAAATVDGCGVKFNGDPRGYAVKLTGLKTADGRTLYNTWGGPEDGFGII